MNDRQDGRSIPAKTVFSHARAPAAPSAALWLQDRRRIWIVTMDNCVLFQARSKLLK